MNDGQSVILNTRAFDFNESGITSPLPENITHLRLYALDFEAPRVPKYGLEINELTKDSKPFLWQECLDYVKDNNLKICWTMLLINGAANLQDEIDLIQEIDDYCGEGTVDLIQVGGEFWLRKYYFGDTSKKACYEQVRTPDYIQMLRDYLPALQDAFPNKKLFASCASYSNQNNQTQNYRRDYTNTIINFLENNDPDRSIGLTFHYYAGYKDIVDDGEEQVFDDIDFSWLENTRELTTRQIIIPEANWYRLDSTEEEVAKLGTFFDAMRAALNPNDIPGIHLLQDDFGGRNAWFGQTSRTVVGDYWIDTYFPALNAGESEAFLTRILPGHYKGRFIYYGVQWLMFSDGTLIKLRLFLQTWKYGVEDLGKPKSFFTS